MIDNFRIDITPFKETFRDGTLMRMVKVTVRSMGMVYEKTDIFQPEDYESFLDHCLERAKEFIKEEIKKNEKAKNPPGTN